MGRVVAVFCSGSWSRHRVPAVATCMALAVVAGTSACTPHPVGPARTFESFEAKARTTAETALSAVETARLTANAAADGRSFGPYASMMLSEQEEAIGGVAGTFESIQPPDERADDVRDELGAILDDAADHVADARIAARRGELGDLHELASPLDDDAAALRAFLEEHGR